jgi:hypothetical protein
VVAEGLLVALGRLNQSGIEDLYTSEAGKIVELQALVTQLESGHRCGRHNVELAFLN